MLNIIFFLISILILCLIWNVFWKPAILNLHISLIKNKMILVEKMYNKDSFDYKLILSIYNKAYYLPKNFDFEELSIIVNNSEKSDSELINQDKLSKETNEIIDFFVNSMISCFLLRKVKYFIPISMMLLIEMLRNTSSFSIHKMINILFDISIERSPKDPKAFLKYV